jgi:hypothetical protein
MYVEGAVQLPDIRQSWEQVANERLAAAGLDVRINHRSHQEGGLEIEPAAHMGALATQMQRWKWACPACG